MFSKSCKYAIRAVLYLAIKSDETSKLGVDELASDLEVPRHFLAKILQQLTRSRIISSSKGRNGGFYLSKTNKSSNLLAVVECIDGPGTFTDCILGLKECSHLNPCPYHNKVQQFRNAFYELIQNETIAESANRIAKNNYKLKNL